MIEVGNRAIAHTRKDIITSVSCAHSLEQGLIGRVVACCTHQTRHRSTCTGTVSNNLLRITRYQVVKVTQVTDSRLQVEQCFRSTTSINRFLSFLHGRSTTTATGNDENITLCQGASAGILCLWVTCLTWHISPHVGAEEDRCLLVSPFWHKDIHILIGRILYIGNKIKFVISCVVHHFAIRHCQRCLHSTLRIKLQSVCLRFLCSIHIHCEHHS